MVTVSMGNKQKKYPSLKAAWEAEAKPLGMKWMTFYMRHRAGDKLRIASRKPVRQYNKAA